MDLSRLKLEIPIQNLYQFNPASHKALFLVQYPIHTDSGKIIEGHSLWFHLYADDTQLYEACRIESLSSLASSTSDCISDVKYE